MILKRKIYSCCCGLFACLMLFCALPCSSMAESDKDATVTAQQLEAFVQEAEREYAYWNGKKPKWAKTNWCALFVRNCLSFSEIGNFSSNGAGDLAREIGKNCASAVYYTASKGDAKKNNRYQLVDMNEYIPVRGDIIVYKRNDNNVAGTHTGIVAGYNAATKMVTTIEGNTSGGVIKKRTVKLRTELKDIGRIAAYVRFAVADTAAADTQLGHSVSLTSDEMHAIEALTSFFYGSQYWSWDTSQPLYDDVMAGLQALFFFEEDLVGTNAYQELDEDGYLFCELISEDMLSSFLMDISGFGLPNELDSRMDFDRFGYYISDNYYQFYLTDYNWVPYIVSVKSLGSDVLLVHAIMRNLLDCENAPTEEELNSQTQYDMYLRRNSVSPYGFTLEWRPQP